MMAKCYVWNWEVYFKPPVGVVGVIHRDLWVSLEDGFSFDDPDSLPDFWDEVQNSEVGHSLITGKATHTHTHDVEETQGRPHTQTGTG
jgi:hypothetical protein